MAGTSIAKLAVMITGDESPLALSLNRGSAHMQRFQADAVGMGGGLKNVGDFARAAGHGVHVFEGNLTKLGSLSHLIASPGGGIALLAIGFGVLTAKMLEAANAAAEARAKIIEEYEKATGMTADKSLTESPGGHWKDLKSSASGLLATIGENTGIVGGFNTILGNSADTLALLNETLKSNAQIMRDEQMKAMDEATKAAKIQSEEWAEIDRQSNAYADKIIEDSIRIEEAMRRQTEEIQRHAESITKSLRTPAEVFADTVAELQQLAGDGFIGMETLSRGITKAQEDLERAGESKRSFMNSNIQVGAVERFTTAGFSAVQNGQSELKRMAEFEADQLAEAKAAAAQRERIIAEIGKNKGVQLAQTNLN